MAKQKSKQTVAKSQVVCRGLLDCCIVGTRLESFSRFEELKDNHFFFLVCLQELFAPFFVRGLESLQAISDI